MEGTCATQNIHIKISLHVVKFNIIELRSTVIQICHASVGILMECLPEGGWFSRGRIPRENQSPEGRHSIRIPTLAWHISFIIPNKPQFGKISMKTTMTAGRSSENGGRYAGGHFAGGHDGMANL